MSTVEDLLHTSNPPASWIAMRGAGALEQVRRQGLPHRRFEDWKYSDLREALAAAEGAAAGTEIGNPFAALNYPRIEIREGSLATTSVQLPAGIEIVDLSSHTVPPLWVERLLGTLLHDGLSGAALALMAGGVAFRVCSGAILQHPIGLFFRSHNSHHARVLLVVEDGAEVALLEHHAHHGRLANIGMEIVLEKGASLRHVRLAQGTADTALVQTIGVSQAEGSRYQAHFSDLGARLSRLELHLSLDGVATQTDLRGLQVLAAGRHSDVTTRINHQAERTASVQVFKQVLGARARAAYQGRITVAQGADGTDSRQTAKAILLDASAEADLKPELLIFADDVQCAHGAAIGDLDADSLFYLRSRGLGEQEARSLLLRAFLEDVISTIASEPVRSCLWRVVDEALAEIGVVS
jgi:Fe-S cluster assembly protein SufD